MTHRYMPFASDGWGSTGATEQITEAVRRPSVHVSRSRVVLRRRNGSGSPLTAATDFRYLVGQCVVYTKRAAPVWFASKIQRQHMNQREYGISQSESDCVIEEAVSPRCRNSSYRFHNRRAGWRHVRMHFRLSASRNMSKSSTVKTRFQVTLFVFNSRRIPQCPLSSSPRLAKWKNVNLKKFSKFFLH